jgi:hypothetical protein
MNNDELDRMKATEAMEKQRAAAALLTESTPTSRLAAHCRKEWERARDAKQPIEERMLRSMRQREGRYSERKLEAIRQMGGSEIKMMLTDVKCRAAIAWIKDVMLGTGERPFSCDPTPLPDIPPQIQQEIEREAYMEMRQIVGAIPNPREVRERIEAYTDIVRQHAKREAEKMAERMEDKIDDEYREGGLYEAFDDLIEDFVNLPAAVLKGPVIHAKKAIQWAQSNDPTRPNALQPVVKNKFQRTWYAASPLDIYLTPEARNSEEGSLVERHRMSAAALYDFIGVPGYDEEQLRGALDTHADTGLKDWLWGDSERSRLEGRPNEQILGGGNDIDVLEVWTKVRGAWLIEWGMDNINDPDRWYNACVWIIGNYVIRATLNDDPMGKRPYHMASYVKVRNSPWGRGVPELMDDLQNMCDAAARAISNNMGIASGPMVEVEADRLASGEKVTKLYPWRIVQTKANKTGTPAPAVRFFQPDSNVQALMAVFEFFSNLADEYTGIPRYQYGSGDVGGAGKTAAGLSMLMNASSRTMKHVISNMDKIIIGTTKQTHRHLMLFDDEMENKGDVEVIAKASQALLHREAQQMRVTETLAATNNPVDFSLMSAKGRLELLRASMRGLDAVDVDKVLPSNDQMLMQAMAAQMQQQQNPQQGPMEEQPQEQIQGAV